jgi:hypothetical protein
MRFDPATREIVVIHRAIADPATTWHVAVDDQRVFVLDDVILASEPLPPPPGFHDAERVFTQARLSILDHDGRRLAETLVSAAFRAWMPFCPDGRGRLYFADEETIYVAGESGVMSVIDTADVDGILSTSRGVAWRTRSSVHILVDAEPECLLETEHAVREIAHVGPAIAALIDPETDPIRASLGTSDAIPEIRLLAIP